MSFKTQLFYRIFEPFLFYAVLKYVTNQFRGSKIYKLIAVMAIILLLPIWLMALTLIKSYKVFVGFLLYIRHGGNFVGFVNGADMMFALQQDRKKSTIAAVLFVDFDGNGDTFFKITSEYIFNNYCKDPKTRSVLRTFSGFLYYLKTKLVKDAIIKEAKIKVNDFLEYLDIINNEEMPMNGEAMVHFCIGKERIQNRKGTWSYPIYIRIHHALGDGYSIIKAMNVVPLLPTTKVEDKYPKITVTDFLKDFWNCIKLSEFYSIRILRPMQDVLSQRLSGKSYYILWSDPTTDVLEKLRMIRKHSNNGTSTMVIFYTALSKSLQDYFERRNMQKPVDLAVNMAMLMHIKKCKYSNFTNNFSTCEMKIPIDFTGNLIDRMNGIKENLEKIPKMMDIKFNDWSSKVFFSLFPNSVLLKAIEKCFYSIIFSSFRGLQEDVKIFNGMKLDSFHYWIPNLYKNGISICSYGYANHMSIGMRVDTAIIPKREDAQKLCDSIVENINIIYGDLFNC